MDRYYFDFIDGDDLLADEEGVQLCHMQAVQDEAARALSGLALDSMRSFVGRQSGQMTIEVRDRCGPVMTVRFNFDIARRR